MPKAPMAARPKKEIVRMERERKHLDSHLGYQDMPPA